jgi:hypothetical protein
MRSKEARTVRGSLRTKRSLWDDAGLILRGASVRVSCSWPGAVLVSFALLAGCLSLAATAGGSNGATDFAKTVYARVILQNASEYHAPTEGLGPGEREALLSARTTFVTFMRSVCAVDSDATAYLADELRHKYPTRGSLVKMFLEEESVPLQVRVFDFRVDGNDGPVLIRYILTLEQDGTICESQRGMTLSKARGVWRIAAF